MSLSALNFPSSVYSHKTFGKHHQKGLVYLCTKKFLPLLLHFWNYNPSLNGQIISFIGAQEHLQIQLLGDWMVQSIEYFSLQNISNQINWRRSQIQSYILSFLVIFAGEQYMKTPVKVSMKVQRIAGALSRMSI